MSYIQSEAIRVLQNNKTKQLVDWVDKTSKITKILVSPEFFHSTHTSHDRDVICEMLKNFFSLKKITRDGNDGIYIEF